MKNALLSNRSKSFYWRSGMMLLAWIVGGLLMNIDYIKPYVNEVTATILGLVLGEISKAINNYLQGR